MNSRVKTIGLWVIIFACMALLWNVYLRNTNTGKVADIPFSQFMTNLQQGNIADATITENEVHGHLRSDKSQYHTEAPANFPDRKSVV